MKGNLQDLRTLFNGTARVAPTPEELNFDFGDVRRPPRLVVGPPVKFTVKGEGRPVKSVLMELFDEVIDYGRAQDAWKNEGGR